ncbi:MAG TPA: hypothetical protein VGN34_32800 [Ktedonobacteraceae bacterium]
MNEKKHLSSVAEYFRLTDRYELRFEFMDGRIRLRDGTPIILLGGVSTEEEKSSDAAIVVIADATEEEIEKLNAFVAELRK